MSADWQLLTDRLRLRPYRADDVAAMFEVFGDHEVMRFSMSGGDASIAVTQARIDKLIAQVQEIYPDVPVDDVDPGWAGLRPMSADGVPIIGLVPGQRNAYLATGHAMLGLTYAPSTAKVLRALIEGDAPEDYRAFAPARFGAHV